jgi:hypothetical protein
MVLDREEHERKVRCFRNRAEEIRTAAEGMRYAETRGLLLRLAECYETMARHIEATAGHLWTSRTGS